MIHRVVIGPVCAVAAALGGAAAAQSVDVPSGQEISLAETVMRDESAGLWVHFRFLAPGIGAGISFETAVADMDALCESFALAYLAENGLSPDRIVIAMADRPVPFGQADPDATQYFEAYRPDGARCIWEEF